MNHVDSPQLPPDALELLRDPRVTAVQPRPAGRSKAGVLLKPQDPPAVGESPYLLFQEEYDNASTAKVTWVNKPAGPASYSDAGSGRGFSRLELPPRFTEARVRPDRYADAWMYTGWLVVSPRFAEIVQKFAADAIALTPVDWTFTDGQKLDGYALLDVQLRLDAYDYLRSEVSVEVDATRGPYIAGLGYPRALRRSLPAAHIFRDNYYRDHIFMSRELAQALARAKLRNFYFEDPARCARLQL